MVNGAPTILVVEDEFLIRDFAVDQLRDSGFEVLAVGDASSAIDLLKSGTPIDLVFTDITLPGDLDGFGLVQWLRPRFPNMPVVLTSGGHNAARASAICKDEPFISKPYHLSSVIEFFHTLLANPTRSD